MSLSCSWLCAVLDAIILNERLRAAGEKAFTSRTLSSLERAIEEADRLAGASMSDWGRLEPTWHSVMY